MLQQRWKSLFCLFLLYERQIAQHLATEAAETHVRSSHAVTLEIFNFIIRTRWQRKRVREVSGREHPGWLEGLRGASVAGPGGGSVRGGGRGGGPAVAASEGVRGQAYGGRSRCSGYLDQARFAVAGAVFVVPTIRK